jgi:hypothetical protein
VAGVVDLDALREKALAATGATTVENGAAALGRHAGAESELPLARALGRLIRAFHKREKSRTLLRPGKGKSRSETVEAFSLFLLLVLVLLLSPSTAPKREKEQERE